MYSNPLEKIAVAAFTEELEKLAVNQASTPTPTPTPPTVGSGRGATAANVKQPRITGVKPRGVIGRLGLQHLLPKPWKPWRRN